MKIAHPKGQTNAQDSLGQKPPPPTQQNQTQSAHTTRGVPPQAGEPQKYRQPPPRPQPANVEHGEIPRAIVKTNESTSVDSPKLTPKKVYKIPRVGDETYLVN